MVGAHNSRGSADYRGFKDNGVRFAYVENFARELKRNGTSHKHLQRERETELHENYRPYRQEIPEHIDTALLVDRG